MTSTSVSDPMIPLLRNVPPLVDESFGPAAKRHDRAYRKFFPRQARLVVTPGAIIVARPNPHTEENVLQSVLLTADNDVELEVVRGRVPLTESVAMGGMAAVLLGLMMLGWYALAGEISSHLVVLLCLAVFYMVVPKRRRAIRVRGDDDFDIERDEVLTSSADLRSMDDAIATIVREARRLGVEQRVHTVKR